MNSGLIIGHSLVTAGCIMTAWNLTRWYMNLLSAIQGHGKKGKPRWIDGLARLSGPLLIDGRACSIIHWVIDYRMIPACSG